LATDLGTVTTQTETLGDTIQSAFSGMGSAIGQAFREGGNVAENVLDAVIGKVSNLADMLLDQALSNLFSGVFGGGSGIGGIVQTGLSVMGLPSYENGTNFHPGGLAMVGEQGPEILNLPRGSQVIPNGRGGGQSTVRIELGPGLKAEMLQATGAQTVQIVEAYDSSLPDRVRGINADNWAT
jgi:hypothetical protein